MQILLAEDDDFLAKGITLALKDSGYSVLRTRTGEDADNELMRREFDLLVLDLGLPKLDGLAVLERLRSRGQTLPVLILTARDRVEERVEGLDTGANDYLVKPFELIELEARIRALLRKDVWNNRTKLKFGMLEFDTINRVASADGKPIELSGREVALLEIFLRNCGCVISRSRLIQGLSAWDSDLSNNALEIIVHRLRKKLECTGLTIRTSRGLGYIIEISSEA
jgi:two-component system OmpR family response regulator